MDTKRTLNWYFTPWVKRLLFKNIEISFPPQYKEILKKDNQAIFSDTKSRGIYIINECKMSGEPKCDLLLIYKKATGRDIVENLNVSYRRWKNTTQHMIYAELREHCFVFAIVKTEKNSILIEFTGLQIESDIVRKEAQSIMDTIRFKEWGE